MEEKLIYFGCDIKAVGNTVKGYLVRFGKPDDTDLEGDYFTKNTDFGRPLKDGQKFALNLYYHHGQDKVIGTKSIGTGFVKMDSVGLWYEAQVDMNDEYNKMIMKLVEEGKLGFSSGAAAHMVERKSYGNSSEISRWNIAEASLTPRPAEYRNLAVVKSLEEMETKPYFDSRGRWIPKKPYEKNGEEEYDMEEINPDDVFEGIHEEMILDSIECLNERVVMAVKLFLEDNNSVNLDDLFMKYAEIAISTINEHLSKGYDYEKEMENYNKKQYHRPVDIRDAEKTLREAMCLSRSESKKLANILWNNLCEANETKEIEEESVNNTENIKQMLLKKAMLDLLKDY